MISSIVNTGSDDSYYVKWHKKEKVVPFARMQATCIVWISATLLLLSCPPQLFNP
jgi:hypothetical protein